MCVVLVRWDANFPWSILYVHEDYGCTDKAMDLAEKFAEANPGWEVRVFIHWTGVEVDR